VAADTLLQQLAGVKTPNQIQLPTNLVLRDTVKDIR
jgi:LacI family transcriptional regulator